MRAWNSLKYCCSTDVHAINLFLCPLECHGILSFCWSIYRAFRRVQWTLQSKMTLHIFTIYNHWIVSLRIVRKRVRKQYFDSKDNMRIAIISDIHSNLEALTKSMELIDTQFVHEIICLGDIIGYGANPNECIDLVRQRCSIVTR